MKTRFLILFIIWIFVFSATPPSFAQYLGGLDLQERGEFLGPQGSDPRQQLAQRIENDQKNVLFVLVIGIPFLGMIRLLMWRKRK